jgi:hypothetical protein
MIEKEWDVGGTKTKRAIKMRVIQGRCIILLCQATTLIIIGSTCGSHAWGEDPNSVIKDIKHDWEEKQKNRRNIRCALTGTAIVPKGMYTDDDDLPEGIGGEIPPKDTYNPIKISLILDFANGRYRKHVEHEVFNLSLARFVHKEEDNIYDGQAFNYYNPESKHGERIQANVIEGVRPAAKETSNFFFGYWEFPMLFAHGLGAIVPDPRAFPETKTQEFTFQGNVVQDSNRRVVLRVQPDPSEKRLIDELWIDRERGSVITRWIRYSSGLVQIHTDIEYQQTPDGWMPKLWNGSHYYGKRKGKTGKSKKGQVVNTLSSSFKLSVIDLKVNSDVTSADFEIKTSPGMIVRDYNNGGGLFKVEKDGSRTQIEVDQNGMIRERHRRLFLIIILLSVVIISTLVFYKRIRLRLRGFGS